MQEQDVRAAVAQEMRIAARRQGAHHFGRQPLRGHILLPAGDKLTYRCGLEPVADAHFIGRAGRNAEKIALEFGEVGFALRHMADQRVGARAGVVTRKIGLAVVAHIAELAVGLVLHHEFGIEHRQAHHRAEEGRIGAVQSEFDRMRIDRRNARNAIGEQGRIALAERHQSLEGEDHIVCGHDIAGMEFHVRTQGEDVVGALDLPGRGEVRRNRRPVLARRDQRVIEIERQDRSNVVDAFVGIGLARRGSIQSKQGFGKGGRRRDQERRQ
jgi:hypothetical protein